jgi:hypothetical protein
MKMKLSLFTILAATMLVSSCGKEKLTPLVAPKTVNELRDDQPIKFSYKIDETQIEEYGKNTGKFPIFGKLFQSIAFVLANSTITSKGGHALDLPTVEVDLTNLEEIDFNYIDWIKMDSLTIMIENAKRKDTLTFISKVEIYALLDEPVEGVTMDEKGYTRLVYFDSSEDKLECEERCINLKVEKINWKKILKANKQIKLQPKIIINSVPKSSMALAGSVGFSVKFKLGF